jgi:hypothetical protein
MSKMPSDFTRSVRNILSAVLFVDPIDVFPDPDQSERRVRFRENPHVGFLHADDETQRKIAEIVRNSLTPAVIQPLEQDCAAIAETITRQEMSA